MASVPAQVYPVLCSFLCCSSSSSSSQARSSKPTASYPVAFPILFYAHTECSDLATADPRVVIAMMKDCAIAIVRVMIATIIVHNQLHDLYLAFIQFDSLTAR